MAKVKIQGHASGTGVLTVTAPNTSTDRTITLPDGDVTLGAATPSIDDNGNATAITIDSSERVGIGAAPAYLLDVHSTATSGTTVTANLSNNKYGVSTGYTALQIGTQYDDGSSRIVSRNNTGNQSELILQPHAASSGVWTDALTLTSDGDVNINSGNLVIGTNGKGIDFSANADSSATGASTTAELLDDYEEGSWTPKLNINNNTTGISYSEQTGVYTKIGRMVYCSCRITLSDKGSLSGDLSVQGLPFSLANLGGCYGVGAMGFGTNFSGSTFGQNNHIFTADPNGTTVYMRYIQDSGNWNGLTNSMIQNDSSWVLGFTYQSA